MPEDTSFSMPMPKLPPGRRVTELEAEVLLQSRMRQKQSEFLDSVWQLARFYSANKHQETAAAYITFLMRLTDDPEKQASYWLALGQTMEQVSNYTSAVSYYKQAFSMEPTHSGTWYFINNNLGYSLIQLGMLEEAEPYCRAAIEIDPSKFNAYKNLWLSLQGQGKHVEAARSLVRAVQASATDPRALRHLQDLVEKHPKVTTQDSELPALIAGCRDAVSSAAQLVADATKKQQEASPELTHAEKIIVAIHRITLIEGREEFSREDVRSTIGVSSDDWMAGYTAIFQAMRADQPGGAPAIDKKYRGIFRQVKHGMHTLTPYGKSVVGKIHHL